MDLERKGSLSARFPRLLLPRKGYTKLDPDAAAAGDHSAKEDHSAVGKSPRLNSTIVVPTTAQIRLQSHCKRKWRLKLKPKVRILFCRISSLIRRMRDSYLRAMIAVAARARKSGAFFPLVYKKKPSTAIAHTSQKEGPRELTDVEKRYMDYVQRSVTDGELAYYTMSLTNVHGI